MTPAAGIFDHWPNRITAARFVGALVLFAVLALFGEDMQSTYHPGPHAGWLQVAFWLFLAVSLSDILDGWLARRGNVVTAFGRVADPFVDKVLVLGAMVFLAVLPWSRAMFPAWIVVVILAREFLVTGIRGYVESVGGEFPADWFGKVKMFVQCVAVGTALALAAFQVDPGVERWFEVGGVWCVRLTLATSVGSGLSYVLKTKKALSEAGA
jgi:CDP-diacylglycerol--glycerol-3-phosphate 3-phosphatidyltransferase